MNAHMIKKAVRTIGGVALVLFAWSCDSTDNRRGAIDPAAPACSKASRDTLLAALNQSCSVSSQCPSGAFCDPTVGGFCNFQCYDNTECPSGTTCNCLGQCVGASTSDGGTPPDPACPRNPALIQSIDSTHRSCTFDDACPNGTFCDTQNGFCAHQCLVDSDCAADGGASDGGAPFCDCFGRCSRSGARPPLPAAILPSLSVLPSNIQLPLAAGATPPVKPSFSTRSLAVSIRAQGTDPSKGPVEKVHVTAGHFLQIQCPAASCVPDPSAGTTCPAPGAEPFVKQCDLQNWSWTTNNTSLLATFAINVQPSAETPGSGELSEQTWSVTFQSNGIEGNVVAASIGFVNAPPTSVGGTWGPVGTLAAGYEGTVTVDFPEGPRFAAQVQALPSGGNLELFDSSYVLSPSGLVTLFLQQTIPPGSGLDDFPLFKWYDAEVNGVPNVKGVDGWLWGRVDPFTMVFQQNSQDGSIDGKFNIAVYANGKAFFTGDANTLELPVHVRLKPAFVKSCAMNPGMCSTADGYTCNVGFCTQRFEGLAGDSINAQLNGEPGVLSSYYDDWYLNRGFLSEPTRVICDYDSGFGLELNGNIAGPAETYSGDLGCATTTNPGGPGSYPPPIYAVPLLVHKDLETSLRNLRSFLALPEDLGADDLFSECMKDLSLQAPPFSSLTLTGQLGLPPIEVEFNYGQGRYFDSSRLCFAPGYFFTAAKSSIVEAPRVHARLMQMWLEMHSFVARQGMQTNELDQILAAVRPTTGVADPNVSVTKPTKAELVDIVTRGLSFVLSEQKLNFEVQYSQDHLLHPDYRADFGATLPSAPHPEWEQPAGYPVAILESAAAYLELVTASLNEVDAATYDQARTGAFVASRGRALRTAGDASRLATALFINASVLRERACGARFPTPDSTCFFTPDWEPRWQQATSELSGAQTKLFNAITRLARNGNPLGISENDLPLFFGDPSGATAQFFASSDYLLNTWAAPAVSTAQNALATARQAWIEARNSQVQDQLLETDRDRRIEQLGEQYGGTIIDNCGISQVNGQAVEGKDVFRLVASGALNLQSCFLDSNPSCAPAGTANLPPSQRVLAAAAAGLTADQADFQLCQIGMAKVGLDVPPGLSECIDGLVSNSGGWRGPKVTVNGGQINCVGTILEASDLLKFDGLTAVDPSTLVAAQDACSQALPFAKIPVPTLPPDCVHGKMGEAYSQLVTADNDLNAASAAIAAKQVALNDQWDNCITLARDEMDRQAAVNVVNQLRAFFNHNRSSALADQSFADHFSFISISAAGPSINPGAFLSAGTSERAAGASAAENELLLNYQDLLTNQARSEGMRACFNQADSLKAEVDAARALIDSRASVIESARVTLSDLAVKNLQQYQQGSAAIARESGRPFAGYAHDYWLDDKITFYRREFDWAQRLTYLAMRAVEYEFQESLPLRKQILTASNADELQQVLLYLQQQQAARTINRRRPELQSLVVSLRDDVLRIPSSTDAPAGERAWTPAQKFEGRLSHPQYTIRDVDGNWLGQGLVFALDPLAGGAQNGIALVNRCAERLWRVTATIQGDSLSTSQPGSPVFVLKRNTFESQWCSGLGDGTGLQTASIQPSHALFSPSDVATPVDDASGFTGSALYPYFNVPRNQFYMSSYQTGSSEELAGRGLYGDYILLFPKELVEAGFPLNNVEDVLLRFDYYSIDNLPAISQ